MARAYNPQEVSKALERTLGKTAGSALDNALTTGLRSGRNGQDSSAFTNRPFNAQTGLSQDGGIGPVQTGQPMGYAGTTLSRKIRKTPIQPVTVTQGEPIAGGKADLLYR